MNLAREARTEQMLSLNYSVGEERLDTESVTRGEDCSVYGVPKHDGELAPQSVQAVSTQVLVKMKHDLAIRSGTKLVSRPFKFLLDRLVTVELAVDDDSKSFVLVRDWLISGRKINNAETRVPEAHLTVRRSSDVARQDLDGGGSSWRSLVPPQRLEYLVKKCRQFRTS
jgi:hypothetical protein